MLRKVPALFSDEHRRLKIALSAALLLAMCIYSGIVGPKLKPRFYDFLEDPARFDGTRLMVQFTQIKEYIGPDRFVARDIRGDTIEVEGKIPPGHEGCFISFDAVFRSPGYLVLGEPWHIYARDTLKLIVSVVGLIGVAVFFLIRFKFSLRRFRFEERP